SRSSRNADTRRQSTKETRECRPRARSGVVRSSKTTAAAPSRVGRSRTLDYLYRDPMGIPKLLRVGFNARLLSSETIRGWNRYLFSLLAELPALGAEIFLYSHLPLHESHLRNLPSGAYKV